MKNISSLSDSELLSKIKSLALEERKLTVEVLRYLREVEVRRLYSARAYSSLHEFCVKELGYSSGAAYRRIQSMRLLKDVPEAEEKVLTGELNLSVLSQIQNYVTHEKKNHKTVSLKEKQNLVECSLGKSAREVQKELLILAPTLAPKFTETTTPLPENKTALKIIADEDLMKLLEEVRTIGGTPGEEISQTLKRLARFYLAKKGRSAEVAAKEQATQKSAEPISNARSVSRTPSDPDVEAKTPIRVESRYISKPEALKVINRAKNQCEYVDGQTKRRYQSKHALQVDHVIGFAKAGASAREACSTSENLQLLCASHNRFKAIQDYGARKMAKYLRK